MGVDIQVPGKIIYRQLSPRMDYMLFCASADDKTCDIWAAPFSWNHMRTTGPATLIFENWPPMVLGGSCTPGFWSPDGKKIAIMQAKKGEIWITSPEGGEPRRLTGGSGSTGWPFWSPDSRMIAFYLSGPTGTSLQVIATSGGEAKTVTQFDLPGGGMLNGRMGQVAWSPDSRALTVVKGGQTSSISLADGQSQPLVNAATDLDAERPGLLRWSPDGKTLAFWARKEDESGRQVRIFLFHSADGRVTKVADNVGFYFWSPDNQWISYGGTQRVKTRPEGVLWEMDIEEAIAKLPK